MRTVVAAGDGFAVEDVRLLTTSPEWTKPETPGGFWMVFVRRGVFRARVGGHRLLADPATAYAGGPGDEQSIAHRVGSQDAYTALSFSGGFVSGFRTGALPMDGRIALAHRLLLRDVGRRDAFELADEAARLVAMTLPRPIDPTGAHRTLIESAKEQLNADPADASLRRLADAVGCSPHHLSRVFHRGTGTTLSRYRNRIRVLRALDAIEAGERSLSDLAAELGFADHAHLTRTVKHECGHTPQGLRRLLEAS